MFLSIKSFEGFQGMVVSSLFHLGTFKAKKYNFMTEISQNICIHLLWSHIHLPRRMEMSNKLHPHILIATLHHMAFLYIPFHYYFLDGAGGYVSIFNNVSYVVPKCLPRYTLVHNSPPTKSYIGISVYGIERHSLGGEKSLWALFTALSSFADGR